MFRRITHGAALLVAVIAIAGCSGASSGQEATPTPIPTPIVPTKPVYQVQLGEVVKKLEFTGRVSPVIEKELFFRTGGYVDAVYVKRDAAVKTGDLLAELEVTDLKNQLAQAEAAMQSTISNNAQSVAEAEASLKTAELRLAQAKAEDPSVNVIVAQVSLERSQNALKEAQKGYQEVLDQPWLEDPEKAKESAARWVHEAELDLKVAEAVYRQAVQAQAAHGYNLQILEQEVSLAQMRLDRLKSGLDVEEMRLTVERLNAQLSDAQVVAPFDGVVLSVSLVEGRAVEGYRPVIIVADPTELEVSADVPDRQMKDLVEGMEAVAAPVSNPGDEVKAAIRRLPYPYGGGGKSEGVAEEDKSTRVSLNVEYGKTGFELGDLLRVTVVLERKADVLWLPPQAIRNFEGRKFVVVQEEGGTQRRVDVKVGIQGEDRVEIEEGVTEGQTVIGP